VGLKLDRDAGRVKTAIEETGFQKETIENSATLRMFVITKFKAALQVKES
jgi:hypothetical protein